MPISLLLFVAVPRSLTFCLSFSLSHSDGRLWTRRLSRRSGLPCRVRRTVSTRSAGLPSFCSRQTRLTRLASLDGLMVATNSGRFCLFCFWPLVFLVVMAIRFLLVSTWMTLLGLNLTLANSNRKVESQAYSFSKTPVGLGMRRCSLAASNIEKRVMAKCQMRGR